MKKELEYFMVGRHYGGCQDEFTDFMMKLGGCAAVAACDSCIYFDRYRGTRHLYPFDASQVTQSDYTNFSNIMKPYLRPRWSGVDRLELFIEGFGNYLSACGAPIRMEAFPGEEPFERAKEALVRQIDGGFLVPCLLLNHADRAMEEYEWHWFLLTGYADYETDFLVKAVTYGEWEWLDFARLWDTGRKRRGGLILYSQEQGADGNFRNV